jgi:heme/copper-type cytochrome/quinol oxidase subunit 2
MYYNKFNSFLANKSFIREFTITTKLWVDEVPPCGSSVRNFRLRKPFTKFDSFRNAQLRKDPRTAFFRYNIINELTWWALGMFIVLLIIASDLLDLLSPFIVFVVRFFVLSAVILTTRLSGSENMDAVTFLYMEVIFLSYAIVFIVVDILLSIERQFSTFHGWNEELLDDQVFRTSPIDKGYFNLMPITNRSKLEASLDGVFLLFPTILVLYMIVPTLGFLYNKDLNLDSLLTDFAIDITGHQWYWTYSYNLDLFSNPLVACAIESNPDTPATLEFDSIFMITEKDRMYTVDNNMVIPSNTPVTLSFTSTDVIHSWALPQIGLKVDTIPGRITTATICIYAEATYYGQCSELCGPYHAYMPIIVEVVSVPIFFDWYLLSLGGDFRFKE